MLQKSRKIITRTKPSMQSKQGFSSSLFFSLLIVVSFILSQDTYTHVMSSFVPTTAFSSRSGTCACVSRRVLANNNYFVHLFIFGLRLCISRNKTVNQAFIKYLGRRVLFMQLRVDRKVIHWERNNLLEGKPWKRV